MLHLYILRKYQIFNRFRIYFLISGVKKRGGCGGCLTRTPYATLIALIMCWAGVAVFCGTMYRSVMIMIMMMMTMMIAGASTSPSDYCRTCFTWTGG